MQRGDATIAILEFLGEAAARTVDIVDTILSSGYGASVGKMHRVARARRIAESERERIRDEEARQRHKYRVLLRYLNEQGFLEKAEKKRGAFFTVTKKGFEHLARLRDRALHRMPERTYEKEKDDAVTIVTFDVPERERRKRDWLRATLKHLGLKMIQKSVWVGKVKIPTAFLEDIRSLRLVEYIEIFGVTKTGSLERLV